MEGFFNQEWQNQNSLRNYPLADDASGVDTTLSFTLPSSFLLELSLPVHAGLNVVPQNFFLRAVSVFAGGYSISIAYNDGTSTPPIVATATIAKTTHVEGNVYSLPGINDFADSVGKIVVGALLEIDQQPAGQFFFDYESGKLDPDCIRPQIRGVSSLVVVSGTDVSQPIYGDIYLTAGDNMQITLISVGDVSEIRLDAIEGAGLTTNCDCTGTTPLPPAIRTIDGIPPDEHGNFNLLGGTCFDVGELAHGLKFTDTCSQPCCGCAELSAITAEIQHFRDEALTLENFVHALKSQIDNMESTILGSRIGSPNCVTC